jgi:hypothetical protein
MKTHQKQFYLWKANEISFVILDEEKELFLMGDLLSPQVL